MEVIKVRCPACKVVMKAKMEYAGRVLRCPACKVPFIVPQTDGEGREPPAHVLMKLADMEATKKAQQEEEASIPHVVIDETPAIKAGSLLRQLHRKNRYMILDNQRMLAYWEAVKGWQLSTTGGSLVPAKNNMEMLPRQGDFRLVELQMEEADDGLKIVALRIYQLARQYTLTKLSGDENDILTTIISESGLQRSQKDALIQALKTLFLRSAWAGVPKIYDYLLGNDGHSSEIS